MGKISRALVLFWNHSRVGTATNGGRSLVNFYVKGKPERGCLILQGDGYAATPDNGTDR